MTRRCFALALVFFCMAVWSLPQSGYAKSVGETLRYTATEGTWLSPNLSPDGKSIVFELLGSIYRVDAAGGKAQTLTSGDAFDSQPAFSLDGRMIVFVSDRSGAENLWTMRADGTQSKQITFRDDDNILTSPTWNADGKSLFVSHVRTDLNAFETWKVEVSTGKVETLIPVEQGATKVSSLSPSVSGDGQWLYYAARINDAATTELPEWTIRRRNLHSSDDEAVIAPPRSYRPDLILGTMFRPVVSRDGKRLIYATRKGAVTWLRLRNLDDGVDRWIAPLTDRDELGANSPWRDLIPAANFTPDGKSVIIGDGGALRRIDLLSGSSQDIPFRAEVTKPFVPRAKIATREDSGPVRARIIQAPEQSPDGNQLAFSAFGHVYISSLDSNALPYRLTRDGDAPTFQPSWSVDGKDVAYVSWTAREGGHIWTASPNGGPAKRISDIAAYYSAPVFTPDGGAIIAFRSSRDERNHRYMEYGPLRDAELVLFPVAGGQPRILAKGKMGGKPNFSGAGDAVNVLFNTGLTAVPLDGKPLKHIVQVTGAGFYFESGRATADDLRLSPDGKSLLVQHGQQLYVIDLTDNKKEMIDLADTDARIRRITNVGADYFGWADSGRSVAWAIGSTYLRDAAGTAAEKTATRFGINVSTPRPVPSGSIVLRGATVVTMSGAGTILDADVLITGDRIAAIGPRNGVAVPTGATVRDVSGRWIVPGFIDAHDHRADVRRGVLDLEMWSATASLAYGVTTLFDPSPLSVDMLVYEDMIDAGLITGSRLRSTGPALFSFNQFKSKAEVESVLSRYRDHYLTGNIKMYRTGNRRVRQWIAQTARNMGLVATTEGAGSTKLGLTMLLDGYSGHEHTMPAVPLHDDVVRLFAAAGTSYTGTLMIQNNPAAQDWFLVRDRVRDEAKFNRFTPRFVVDMKTRSRMWFQDDAYRFPDYASSIVKVARAGGLVAMGSHGEMPGIGFHWEMRAHAAGGMTPNDVLQAATIGSATAIGRSADLGSLETGKLADMLVLTRDPLQDVEHLASVAQVMKGGQLYDADTLNMLYPNSAVLPDPWFLNDMPPTTKNK